ncbi:MAG: putative transcriptional regulator [Rhodothermales bacterium]
MKAEPDADSTPLRVGVVLAAVPILRDPNFYRSVVLICDHNDSGSFGLVLNRDTSIEPESIMEELGPADKTVRIGGPVQPNTLHYVHEFGDRIAESIRMADGLWWGGDFDELKRELAEPTLEAGVRLFMGYSGWGTGQLQDELDEGSWVVAPVRSEWVFRTDPDAVWRQVMLSLGGEWALVANYPDDPRLN